MTRKPLSNGVSLFAAMLLLAAVSVRAAETAPARSTPVSPVAPAAPAAAAPAPAAAAPFAPLALDSDQQKTLYALGLALSQSIARLDLQASELAYLVQGLQDGVLSRDPRVDLDDYADKVQGLAQSRLEVASQREQAREEEFLTRMAAKPGAVKTDSGIVYIAQQEGTGPSPKPTDTVRVNYEGKLPDGTVFDSSIQRGEPANVALDQVIPCWTEAVQKMKVGGRAEVVCPAELAYGEDGSPGIPPNSALVFDIHLLGIGDTATAAPGQKEQHPPLLQQVASAR